jgi:hypothetical protein
MENLLMVGLMNGLKREGKKHPFWKAVWEFEHRDKDGKLIDKWEAENALADEGEENILDAYLRGQNEPTTFYLALYNDTPTETDSLDDLSGEPVGDSYEGRRLKEAMSAGPRWLSTVVILWPQASR